MRRFVTAAVGGVLPVESTISVIIDQRLSGSLGLRLREGTIVDATIIEAPSSTKNRAGARDPEMRQTKKGNQYHLG